MDSRDELSEMTSDELRDIGERVFGYGWQTKLAAHLKIADRTVRRWAAGASIPAGAQEEIRALASIPAPPTVDRDQAALPAFEPHLDVVLDRALKAGWEISEITGAMKSYAEKKEREA